MEEALLNKNRIQPLLDEFLKAGYIVVADSPDGRGYTAVKDSASFVIDSGAKPGKTSFKQFLFPRTEPLFYYRKDINDIALVDPPDLDRKFVVFGAKPCDAKSPEVLAKVFNWDYKDEFFNKRAENTVVIGLACTSSDDFCFCTSVGLSPTSTAGSDIFLVPLSDGSFGVRVATEKGRKFLEPFAGMLDKGDAAKSDAALGKIAEPAKKFDAAGLRTWIDANFESPAWKSEGATCLGCAQCAFVCPVCHCFDIVDEADGFLDGRRMKNWDACQFGLFTKHASGHNPRNGQSARYRQRVSHKFAYYPEKFGEILCTGCGRCSRGCPAGIDIAEVATRIAD